MKRLQEFLMKDLGWKLLSIAIAAIMWYMVISINQPVDTRTYSTMLQVDGITALYDKGLTLSNEDEITETKVNIKIKGQRTALDRLSQRQSEMLRANVDVSDLGYIASGDKISKDIRVILPNSVSGYEIVGKFPSKVELHIEKLVEKEVSIEPVLTNDGEKSKKLSVPALSEEKVVVKGPKSKVDTVATVRALVNAQQALKNGVVEAPLTAYNRYGEAVEGVVLSQKAITVTYGIYEEKHIPISVEVTGTPVAGYHVTGIVCNPKTMTIVGKEEDLARLDQIYLEEIDVSGKNTSVTKSYPISRYLPEGCYLRSPAENNVQVVVQIGKSEIKRVTVPAQNIAISNEQMGYIYTLPESVTISLVGNSQDLSALGSITGTVDAGGLEEGEHYVNVTWHLPSGVTTTDHSIMIVVEKEAVPPAEELQGTESDVIP